MEDELDLETNISKDIITTSKLDVPLILEGGAAAAPLPPPPERDINKGRAPNNKLNENMLQIVDSGINKIVQDLKNLLGSGNGGIIQVNNEARLIIDALNNITLGINNNLNIRDLNGLYGSRIKVDGVDGNHNVLLENSATTAVNPNINNVLYNQTLNEFLQNNNNYNIGNSINTVDDSNPIENAFIGDSVNLENQNHKDAVQSRLNNCRKLEELYLIKHVELMKTFTFTINLFDKYKYAVKIMLFLLKNLVYKDKDTSPDCGKVNLPKPLIPNIRTLIQDQQAVQGIITDMKRTVEREPVSNRTSPIIANEPEINRNLQDTGAPP